MKPLDSLLHYSIPRSQSAVEDDVLRRRIQHRTTTDSLAKGFAEMAQTQISDFCSGFSDIVSSRAQQLRRAFHPQLAQILRNGQTDFAGKNPAQIKRTAADFLADCFQRRWICKVTSQDLLDALDPLARDAFLPHAEKLRIFRSEKKMRHKFERF